MVLQSYVTEAGNEYVIRGNSALIKCGIASYMADLVVVDAWVDSDGRNYGASDSHTVGKLPEKNHLIESMQIDSQSSHRTDSRNPPHPPTTPFTPNACIFLQWRQQLRLGATANATRSEQHPVLPGFTGFYRVLLGFTGFYWVLMGAQW